MKNFIMSRFYFTDRQNMPRKCTDLKPIPFRVASNLVSMSCRAPVQKFEKNSAYLFAPFCPVDGYCDDDYVETERGMDLDIYTQGHYKVHVNGIP
ncbi:hypothetical protein RCL_jg12763.t1 [Rhizophagus clarus]|uniref:Uncharacterized protein n=1 Tax=Rhizophagus clarus TaxID=94130 RepID=A0A8H3QE34_9GLOM|nr:hypothetical protein RCL_jg12763.t1 [Rhizophagus clarus]